MYIIENKDLKKVCLLSYSSNKASYYVLCQRNTKIRKLKQTRDNRKQSNKRYSEDKCFYCYLQLPKMYEYNVFNILILFLKW